MAVPARDVLRVETRQLAAFDDHVLEHLVQRVADMQLAVGVGRAVVQHEQRRALARGAQAQYKPPSFQSFTQPGSRLGRSPRMGKGVSGMFSVPR